MTQTYLVKGITCGGCVTNVKTALEAVPGVKLANVQKAAPQAVVETEFAIDDAVLQEAIAKKGKYELTAVQQN